MKQPEAFKEKILLVSLGVSPQIITEVVYALTVGREQKQQPAFVPTRIVVVSTKVGIKRCQDALEKQGYYQKLINTYQLTGLPTSIEYRCISNEHEQLEDIRTSADNEAAADTIFQVVKELTANNDAAVHISIAGGRKTQGYYTGLAASLYGRAQDRLSHVLVTEGFEGHWGFYFPPREEQLLTLRINGEEVERDAREAEIELADLPFMHMRHELPEKSLLLQPHLGVRELVRRLDIAKHLQVDYTLDLSSNPPKMMSNGVEIELENEPLIVAYLLIFYWDKVESDGPEDEGVKLPPANNNNLTYAATFTRALACALRAIHGPTHLSFPEDGNARDAIDFLQQYDLHQRSVEALLDENNFEYKALKSSFYSSRRSDLKKILMQELPESWADKLLPKKFIQDGENLHRITLPLERFTVIGLE